LHAKGKKVKQTPVKEQEEIAVFVFLKKGRVFDIHLNWMG